MDQLLSAGIGLINQEMARFQVPGCPSDGDLLKNGPVVVGKVQLLRVDEYHALVRDLLDAGSAVQ